MAETSVSFDISVRRYDGDQKEDIARNKITIEGEGLTIYEGELTEDDGDPPSFSKEYSLDDPPVGIYILVEHPVTLTIKVFDTEADDWVDLTDIPLSRVFLYEGQIGEFNIYNSALATYETIKYKVLVMK